MHRLTRISCTTAVLALTTSLVVSACSSDNKDGSGTGGNLAGSSNGNAGSTGHGGSSAAGGSSAQSAGSSSGGSSSGGSSSVGSGGSSSSVAGSTGSISTVACPGLPLADGSAGAGDTGGAGGTDDGACTGVSVEAESVPVDMFIMMDRSQSMGFTLKNGMTRMQAVQAAVQSFVSDPSAGAIGAGLGFFGLSGGADDTLDCNVASYAKPTVAIAPLSTNGPELVKAINDIVPAGLTPTVPALQGALSYAKDWAAAHVGRATIVVLVTDGFPTQCDSASPDQIASAAMTGYAGDGHIKTYVIGVGDFSKFNLDNYAQSGGTQNAFLTDESMASDSFLHALLNITNSKIACQYGIPKPIDTTMQVDPKKVQVVYTPASGAALEVPKVEGLAGCATSANGGWYYDNDAAPTVISVCPCTCSSFAAGRVDVRLGCSPHIGIR
jgi:von Willebrand factor type A domain